VQHAGGERHAGFGGFKNVVFCSLVNIFFSAFQSQDFPLTIDPLLDILQVLEPVNPTVRKVRAFCSSGRLPTGFPVQMGEFWWFEGF
jgi:hypothetical protein